MATYSSIGPTRFDHLVKPDLVAPGNKIRGPGGAELHLVKEHPELVTGTGANMRLTGSGTSQATAVTSGAVADLLQVLPNATPRTSRPVYSLGPNSKEQGWRSAGRGA